MALRSFKNNLPRGSFNIQLLSVALPAVAVLSNCRMKTKLIKTTGKEAHDIHLHMSVS